MALALQHDKATVKTISGLDGVVGLWLILAPFVLGYTAFANATWNDIIIGAAVLLLAGSRTFGENYKIAWPSWVNVALGVWLLIAPFVLAYPTGSVAITNDIVAGFVIAGLATWSALATPKGSM